eukprot:s103_g35.t1
MAHLSVRRALRGLLVLLSCGLWYHTGPAADSLVMAEATNEDLLVVGAGYLGRRVAQLWRSEKPQAKVLAATLTEKSHEALREEGLDPILASDLKASKLQFSQVVFCAPPSRDAGEYAKSVTDALEYLAMGGIGVFTSSASVFAEDSGNSVDESGAVSDSGSAQRMLEAEEAAQRGGSAVLRLAGLYDLERGPHSYWLKVGVVKGAPEGLINLVHYDDAAQAVVDAIKARRPEVYVISDGVPISRRNICAAAVKSKHFAGKELPTFEAPAELPMGGTNGKRLDASKARQQLGWRPRYVSFAEYMAAH